MARRMLTIDDAAQYLGTSVRHMRRLVSDHHLAHYKVGGPLTSTSTSGSPPAVSPGGSLTAAGCGAEMASGSGIETEA